MLTEWTRTFTTADGLLIEIRPLRVDDAPYLIDIFEHLGADSRYLRFHEPLTNADPAWVLKTAQDIAIQTSQCGWGCLAFADLPARAHVPIAGARYVCTAPNVAEVAMTVRDDLQGKGIGRKLLQLVIEHAQEEGIERLKAVVQASNKAVLKLLGESSFPVKRERYGAELIVEVDIKSPAIWRG